MLRGSCYKCLKEGHRSTECTSKKSCVHCGELDAHHRSLCPKKFGKKTHVFYSKEIGESVTPQDTVLVSSDEMVLMQTARTDLRSVGSDHCENARLLLDSGSQRTYIAESLATKLGLKSESEQELKLVTFGSEHAQVIKTKTVKVDVKLKDNSFITVTANVVPTISGDIQRNSMTNVLTNHMKQIVSSVVLADNIPSTKECASIDFLIGNNYYLDLVLPQRIELGPGLYLLSSKLGWILTGRTHVNEKESQQVSMFVMTHGTDVTKQCAFSNIDTPIPTKPDLEDFWNVESIGITDNSVKTNDEVAMDKFKNTVIFEDGRYQVTWPWKDEVLELPTNRQLSLGRLKSTVSRLTKRPELLQKYNDVIQDQLSKGVIEKVDFSKADGPIHYIPHHPVISHQKTTTKLRLVYDASAKSRQENNSLNECLYRGPVILQHICGVLLRFRLHSVAIVADIEKAFLQIGLQPDQRDVTRFLWFKDSVPSTVDMNNIQEYRFCRVPFGIISSPFLLGATVQHHMDSFDTEVAEQVKRDIYVDNLITGTSTDADAIRFYQTVKPMFQSASMNLREWITNSDVVNTYIPVEDRADPETMTVLGLCWNPKDDTISLKQTDTSDGKCITKRSILKKVASSFDPLGLFSPVILRGKILIQYLWEKKLDWDDEVEQKDELEWNSIKRDLDVLAEHKVQRCVTHEGTQDLKSNIVCFCDASEKAYATVIYLYQTSTNGSTVELLFSKSRLAPLKRMTIPRLEIMAVVIGVRCMEFVHQQLEIPIHTSHLYTDSQCVLKWISSNKDLPIFVKNRVSEIKKHKGIKFSYVRTNNNPADVATRGTTMDKLSSDALWWHGPQWLLQSGLNHDEEDEVTQDLCTDSVCQCVELEKEYICETAAVATEKEEKLQERAPFGLVCEDYSSVTKLLRVTAYVNRFLHNLKSRENKRTGVLTSSEILHAEMMWIVHVQKKHYGDVLGAISEKKSQNLIRQLNLFLDDRGILRCRGRLQHAELSEGSRYPILLPRHDNFTRMIIIKHHTQILHCGVSQTLSSVRYKYWIPQGRATVKSVLRQCNVCRRIEGGPYKVPEMPPLPKSRVTCAPPFCKTGLDYLGPLYIKTQNDTKKVWVCLFTCMVTRAIHLELVQDMTAEEFILGFRRFKAQRGVPNEIISDNALHFKTANSTIDMMWTRMLKTEEVLTYISEKRVHWHYIVDRAPWCGGFYERLVGLVKRALRKTLGRKLLTMVQMFTVLKEVEAVVNSRPLVYVGDDIHSNITLTPLHFLSLNPKVGTPNTEGEEGDQSYNPCRSSADKLLDMWKKGNQLLDKFWKIWKDEYLLSLRERMQTRRKTGRIQSESVPSVGDITLIKDDLPRSCWKIARVTKLNVSSDGLVRSAEVQLSSGRILKRPLNLLFPIETSERSVEESDKNDVQNQNAMPSDVTRVKRKAAEKASQSIAELYKH